MQRDCDFHTLAWCREILNLLKTSFFLLKLAFFMFIGVLFILQHWGEEKVRSTRLHYALCFLYFARLSQMAVLSQRWEQLQVPTRHCYMVKSGQCPSALITSIDKRSKLSQKEALLFLLYKWGREAPKRCDLLGIVVDVWGRAAL